MRTTPQPELPIDPALDNRLTELRSRFKAVLPERVAAISQRMADLAPGPWSPTAVEDLRTEVHSLAGSSGLFGFEQVGAAAGDLERLLIGAFKKPAVSHADVEELRDALARLDQTVRLAVR